MGLYTLGWRAAQICNVESYAVVLRVVKFPWEFVVLNPALPKPPLDLLVEFFEFKVQGFLFSLSLFSPFRVVSSPAFLAGERILSLNAFDTRIFSPSQLTEPAFEDGYLNKRLGVLSFLFI